MNTITLTCHGHSGPLVVEHDNGTITAVTLPTGETVTSSYRGTCPMFGHPDAPAGTIFELTVEQLEDVATYGGTVLFFGDDLHRFTVQPAALDPMTVKVVEEAMTPPWPTCENVTGPTGLTFSDQIRLAFLDIFEEGPMQ